jgi:acetyl esterase/lipase
MLGDSAGGDITLGSLKMRYMEIGLPAAVVVFYPNTDLTLSGDTVFTLRNANPVLDVNATKKLIAAHACPPYASQFMVTSAKGFHLR